MFYLYSHKKWRYLQKKLRRKEHRKSIALANKEENVKKDDDDSETQNVNEFTSSVTPNVNEFTRFVCFVI